MTAGRVIRTIPSPGPTVQGITIVGNMLLAIDRVTRLIYYVSIPSGRLVRTVAYSVALANSGEPRGVSLDGRVFWIDDPGTANERYLSQRSETNIIKSFNYPVPAFGVAPVGNKPLSPFIIMLNNSLSGRFIHLVDPITGSFKNSVVSPTNNLGYPIWDGACLWFIDTTLNTIYRINMNNGRIITSFAAPATGTRGLAFDGRTLWVQDVIADTIYQIQVS